MRQRDVDPLDLSEYRDLPVTGIALTAIEAAVVLGPDGSVLLDRALQQHVTYSMVSDAHCRNLGHAWKGYVIDVAFPRQRIAIEVDGWAWHRTPDRFVRDGQRQNAVVNGGWHVLRFSWHDLTHRPEAVLAEIRDALRIR